MIANITIASNPFFDAYYQSDVLGKLIIISLIVLSVCSWVILIHKSWLTYQARKSSENFYKIFILQKQNPLALDITPPKGQLPVNPFASIYEVLKKNTVELLNKNKHFSKNGDNSSYLSPADVDYVEGHLLATITGQTKFLEKNLFILATIVSLGPFLGLLGTVWGILTTFSDMNTHVGASTHQAVLGGLSLALATTVLGLIDAIPALIGYNYLKSNIRDFTLDMDGFAHEILSSVEMQYRKVDSDG
jgi:biopolymer transport protein TolQ